jgi:glutathione synthase/RimK-type ligase-like ATP-grasp enzyme
VTSVALATCADLPSLVADDAPFLAALRDRGASVEPVVWSDETVDWNQYDVVVVRSIWDYYERPGEFAAWVDDVEAASCDVWNRPETLRWNSHKFYLRDLADRGVQTLPTAYVERGRDLSLAAVFEDRGWDELVVKPAVSAGASRTRRIARSGADAEQSWVDDLVADTDVLVQAFADDIAAGEWSLVFFGTEYSHAVVKRPEPGDFRVQADHGGSVDAGTPDDAVRRQGARVVDAVSELLGHAPLYARVDGIERQGAFHLLEVELIEPELFFRVDPAAGRRLADRLLSVA